MKMKAASILVIGLFVIGSGCTKAAPPAQKTPDLLNRVNSGPPIPPKNFLHKTFKVAKYTQFDFEVPPNSVNPKLQGSFKSYLPGSTPDSGSDASSVDFLLMNAEEFDDFAKGKGDVVRYSISAAHSQDVDYSLPTALGDPVKYYVVFRNPGGAKVKMVEADLTVSF